MGFPVLRTLKRLRWNLGVRASTGSELVTMRSSDCFEIHELLPDVDDLCQNLPGIVTSCPFHWL
jgi:hypothetical protein